MSLHFRGPLDLKKVAVYYPSGSKQYKRAAKRDMHFRRHSHHRHHRYGDAVAPEQDQSGSSYKRTGYYDAASGVAQGLVFLNHMGGQASGVWDTLVIGISLSGKWTTDFLSGASETPFRTLALTAMLALPNPRRWPILSWSRTKKSSSSATRSVAETTAGTIGRASLPIVSSLL